MAAVTLYELTLTAGTPPHKEVALFGVKANQKFRVRVGYKGGKVNIRGVNGKHAPKEMRFSTYLHDACVKAIKAGKATKLPSGAAKWPALQKKERPGTQAQPEYGASENPGAAVGLFALAMLASLAALSITSRS